MNHWGEGGGGGRTNAFHLRWVLHNADDVRQSHWRCLGVGWVAPEIRGGVGHGQCSQTGGEDI